MPHVATLAFMRGPLKCLPSVFSSVSVYTTLRTIYLDESGTSLKNPVAVVCGVIIDADSQWEPIEAYMSELVAELVPSALQPNFVFHASELFGGQFGKDKGHRDAAREALRRIVGMPWRFGIPVSFGFYRKTADVSEGLKIALPKDQVSFDHTMPYLLCASGCERYMRRHARPYEIATMVAENNNETKKAIKRVHSVLQGNHGHAESIFRAMNVEDLPLRRIKDTVHFAEKKEAVFLQMADAFAFVFRRFLEGIESPYELYDALLVEPAQYENLRPLQAGCRLMRQKPNPLLFPDVARPLRRFSTIPGHEEMPVP